MNDSFIASGALNESFMSSGSRIEAGSRPDVALSE